MKNHFEYYPNRLARQHNFPKQQKNKERFADYCLGPYRHYYNDTSNYGYSRSTGHLAKEQIIKREYLYKEFAIWESWKNAGSNIFDFTKDLLALLKDTSVSDLELGHLKLPYQSIYIDLSGGGLYFDEQQTIPVEGFFVREAHNDLADKEITFERVISFDFTGEYIEHYHLINQQLMEHARGFHSYSLYHDAAADIFKVGQSAGDAKNVFISHDIATADIDTKLDLYSLHRDFISRTINLAVNCLLYLTLKDKDIVQELPPDIPIHLKNKLSEAATNKQRAFALKEIGTNGFTKINMVGAKAIYALKSASSTNSISPHWRRGRWRIQGYGVGHKEEQKLIWIQPTIVNSSKGEPLTGHIYNLTD